MNGELAQLVALATHGTAWLRGGGTDAPPQLDVDNSTFKFVRVIEFFAGDEPVTGAAVWLRGLAGQGVERLWLTVPDAPPVRTRWPHLEPHMEVAFSNAGGWRLLATGAGTAATWTARWQVEDLKAADRRIWTVRVERQATPGARPRQHDLAESTRALRATIEAAREFAARELPDWTEWFDRALSAGTAPPFHPDLMPPAFPEPARHLAAVAAHAWVFGGMGSWNDVGLPDGAVKTEHADLSRLLFSALLQAIVAAVNCDLE